MKTFLIESEEFELRYLTAYYEVKAETEEEAKQIVLRGEGDCVDTQGGDYVSFDKEFAEKVISGEEPIMIIVNIQDKGIQKEQQRIQEEKEIKKQIEELTFKLNNLKN